MVTHGHGSGNMLVYPGRLQGHERESRFKSAKNKEGPGLFRRNVFRTLDFLAMTKDS